MYMIMSFILRLEGAVSEGSESVDAERTLDGQVQGTVEYLKERLNFHINDYRKKRNENRFWASAMRLATILAGGTTTVLLGVKSSSMFHGVEEDLSMFALVLSAVVTALTTWEGFGDYHWKWVRYRTTLYDLYTLRDDLLYELAGGGIKQTSQLENFYNRLRIALKETDEQWVSQRVKAFGTGGMGTVQPRKTKAAGKR
jgi:hypothetical protein